MPKIGDFRDSGSALSCSWAMGDEETANAVLRLWLGEARASALPHFVRPAQSIEEHLAGLLAYFRHPIATGPQGHGHRIAGWCGGGS